MSSDSAARKRNVQSKKKKGSAGNISPGGISVREIPVSKPTADELIHVQKDVQFGENWCKIAVFIAISSALAGVGYYYALSGNDVAPVEKQRGSATLEWIKTLRFDLFGERDRSQEPIDEEPSVDVELEPSYLDVLWSYYPFGQPDESSSNSEVPPEEQEPEEEEASKESETDTDSREDSKESPNDDELDNDKDDDDDEKERESEENQDDEKNTEDDDDDDLKDDSRDDQNDEDNDENDDSKSTDDSENTYESRSFFSSYKKHEAEDDEKDSKDDVDSSDESKEQLDRRDQRFNYYHHRDSEEENKYKYIKGEDDSNDSSEQGASEKFDSAENTKDQDEQDDKDREDDSHSSEEAERHLEEFTHELDKQEPEIDEEPQSGNMVTKLSVGIALIFVAYSVIIRKWNNYVNRAADEAQILFANVGADDGDLADIAQTIAENLLDSINNEASETENKTLQDYLETPSNSAGEQSEDDSANEPSTGENIPIDSEKSETPSETESETDDEHAEYGKSSYSRMNITNRADWPYRHQLDEADDDWDREDIFHAVEKYAAILRRSPKSVRAQYGMVRFHDSSSDSLQSNTYLHNVIRQYKQILKTPDVPEVIEKIVAAKIIERMRFVGQHNDCIPVLKMMVRKYPEELSYQIDLAVTYLILNRLPAAESVLIDVLKKDPNNGLALVNYGFIKKMNGELEKAVIALSKGIKSGVKGTGDSKFYYHLGEALQRLGRREEALKLYQSAADKGVFLSKYQRSLYNINRLKHQPWWNPADTEYKDFFRSLESNWETIRNEVQSVIQKEKYDTFRDETEQLRETGEWKQLEIFNRGEETPHCKKFPVTCGLIKGFAPAATCRRGQVKFSVMQPGTHVWPHCGPTNCRLRAHLGLIVPENVTIRVADETRTWREGEVLLFDDSFEHEVWHNGTSTRLILIVDVWHPEISENWRKILTPI